MSEHQQANLAITRRGFVQSAIGSLIALPAVGGVGLFSQQRVAYAVGAEGQAGAVYTNEEYAKITVVTRDEVAIVVIDMAKMGLDPLNVEDMDKYAKNEEAFVTGAKVKLISRYCQVNSSRYDKDSVEGVTDEEGKVIFNIQHLAENLDYVPLDKIDPYEFNGTIEVSCEGYRTFKTALFRIHGTDVLVAPTRFISPDDTAAYPHMVSFNEWDVLYYANEFLTSEGNTFDQTLAMEGRGFGNDAAIVTLREQVTYTELASTTVTPEKGVIKASFTHKFCLLGGENSMQVGKAYELMVVQGSKTYIWPLQMSLVEGVAPKEMDNALDFNPFNTSATSGTFGIFKWPESIPLLGGSQFSAISPFTTAPNVYFDPFGYVQITVSAPLVGYKKDNGKGDEQGWGAYPHASMKDQMDKWNKSIEGIIKKTKDSYKEDGVFRHTDFKVGISMMIFAQVMAAMKWDDPKHVFRGSLGGQFNLTLNFIISEQWFVGPVPCLVTFSIDLAMVLGLFGQMHTEPEDPGDAIYKQVFDVTCWRVEPSGGNISFNLTLTPALSLGVGIRGLASATAKGKIVLSIAVVLDTSNDYVKKNKPMPHCIGGWSASVSIVLQFFCFSQSWTLWSKKYTQLFDNWDGLKAQAEDGMRASADAMPSLSEFIGGMDIVTSDMMAKSIEATGKASQGMAAQSLEAQDAVLFDWSTVRLKHDDEDGLGVSYATYRFARPAKNAPTQGMPAKDGQSFAAGAVSFAQQDPGASRWHCSTVTYDDQRLASVRGPEGGMVAQADDEGFLPEPGVESVKNTGGVQPSSDVIISTHEDGSPRYVYGDPHIRVLDVQTGASTSTTLRATCAFRIGTVAIDDAGTVRTRLIMTVLDAGEAHRTLVGKQRVIDFNITDLPDVSHADLYDYEFGLAFSSYSGSAGGVSGSLDQVEIVIVSGKRAAGDGTSVVAAGTDLYFTYLNFDATAFFSDDFANSVYFQVTLPASRVLNPEGQADGKYHSISNINCVSQTKDAGGALLVSFLDRVADTPEGVFSDDDSVVTVMPRFLIYRSDLVDIDVKVPNSAKLNELLDRLNRKNATVLRMVLSPEIGGRYTLAMQAQSTTYFYLLAFDAASGVFTEAAYCSMLDSSIELVPWPAQDCFLTSFVSEEYLPTIVQGDPEKWDRSKWVLQKAWWAPSLSDEGNYVLYFEEIGPDSFNFSRFALNNSGTFIFWPEGRSGSDEYHYDVEGNYTVEGEDDAVYQIKACRVRNNADGSLHFSDPFVAADVPHDMDTLEAVPTHNRYAPFEILSTELQDTGEKTTDNEGNEAPLYHAAYLWYTSVPNLQCATVVASNCTLPAVSAGRTANFDVHIRNDGNSFLSGCTIQMYVHDLQHDDKYNPVCDAKGDYIDNGVSPVGDPFPLTFSKDTLLISSYDPADSEGNFLHEEPDFALPPGKRSVYRVTVPIPAEWEGVKWVSFHASDPQMAEGGGLAAMSAMADDDAVFQQFSVEPGTYPVVQQRANPDQSKSQRFMMTLPINDASSAISSFADAPVTVYETGTQPMPAPSGKDGAGKGAASKGSAAKTGDGIPWGLLAGAGAAGAAMAAYSKRRLENEKAAAGENDQGDGA